MKISQGSGVESTGSCDWSAAVTWCGGSVMAVSGTQAPVASLSWRAEAT
jgi:hypothetical protein